jgi:hypothetical protein
MSIPTLRRARLATAVLLGSICATPVFASEGGGSLYPVGVDSLAPGMLPPKKGVYWYHYTVFYDADRTNDASGKARPVTPFSLNLIGSAERLLVVTDHKLLGGSVIGQVILPYAHLNLRAGTAHGEDFAFGDASVGAFVLWNRGKLHYWLGAVQYAPTGSYRPDRFVNIGRNYWATTLQGGISYFPIPKFDVGVKTYLGFNATNKATQYKTGKEAIVEYMAGYRFSPAVRAGVQGYYYDQISDDRKNGRTFALGNQGRAFAIGPAIGVSVGRTLVATKLQKELMAENRPRGTRVWLQWMVPLSSSH